MSRSQEKIFSTLGPKLRGSKALQEHGDKLLQIHIELIDYVRWVPLIHFIEIYIATKHVFQLQKCGPVIHPEFARD